jgi:hypothetical protein
MKRLFLAGVTALWLILGVPAFAADNGNAPPTLSFFSGGGGAHAGWVHTDDQPPGDTDGQAIHIHVTPTGYAGVLVHHVYGMPTSTYPNSKFDFKSNLVSASSLGYPRLVILFSDGGRGELRPLTWQPNWTTVQDPYWDNGGGLCGYNFQVTWQHIQACHPGTIVTNAYITTDPGIEVDFWIDNLETAGKRWTSASDNGNGDNSTATFTPDLLPAFLPPL